MYTYVHIQVAVALNSDVYTPMEVVPLGRLYVIMKGSARYKGGARGPGCELALSSPGASQRPASPSRPRLRASVAAARTVSVR